MTLDELCARRVAVWGMGQEGVAVTQLLRTRGVEPRLVDDDPDGARRRVAGALGTATAVVAPDGVRWADVEVVVRSPGVSRYRDELAAADAAGVAVTTCMAIWLEDMRDAPVLAVTGTKGKSTTASLAASILAGEGLEVALAGNIGVPVTDLYGRAPVDAYVVEVSSYQAADVTVSPRVCVVTSLAPDHLQWHRGEERYYRDKLRLVDAGPARSLAVNAGSAELVGRTAGHPGRMLFGPSGAVRVGPSGWITAGGRPVVDAARLRVPGEHNVTNLCGAVAGVWLLRGAPPSASAVAAAVDAFEGLPSRCRVVGERGGLTFVDDALASNPFAAGASIRAFGGRALTVIVGGAQRGADPGPVVAALAGHEPPARVVAIPPEPGWIVDALVAPGAAGPPVVVDVAADLADAVRIAVGSTPPGGVVLFSPGAPTPEGEGGYRARSRAFAAAAGLDAAPASR